ncbi:MAG TPA: KUP/HAK/KT family potassium transporter [Solirubrobacteraceae bacterium]|nr:KUP/HAK/KT family potassium transporter [Solirubrobacteraceae bacterium]
MANASAAETLPAEGPPHASAGQAQRSARAALMVGALGVVFGDIGTSPLYSIQTVFEDQSHAVHPVRPEIFGVISLVFWTITIVVSVKYVIFIMRADDRGEGGIMALTSILRHSRIARTRLITALVLLGVLGAALFYGDSTITPAISVLSAMEGLKVAAPGVSSAVVPLTAVVLAALFALQRFGTHVVGRLFGPIMLIWFAALALFGGSEVIRHPSVLQALSPTWGARFFLEHGVVAYLALAAVVLAVTGAEALYADMGHFGRAPIRRAWFLIVFPALTLDYLAQGAVILRSPKDISNPFYLLLPSWAQLPMVFLATVATVIASQAVISGTYSVTQQAVQLGFLPRLTIRHTSAREIGQIYVPAINAILFVIVLAIVFAFGSSSGLAAAYGVAVTGTFVLTTVLFLSIARLFWHTRRALVTAGGGVLLTVDIAFFTSNLTKVIHGGWLPLAVAACAYTIFTTWNRGREIVTENRHRLEGSLQDFVEEITAHDYSINHVPGVAVFLNPRLESTPLALRANIEHNHAIHDTVLIVSVAVERVAHIPDTQRVRLGQRHLYSGATGDPLAATAEQIIPLSLHYGFRDRTDVPAALRRAVAEGQIPGSPDIEHATYFLSKVTINRTSAPGMAGWRKRIFLALARNAADPAEYFHLPDGQTVITSGRIGI